MPKQVLNQHPKPDLDAVFAALAHPTRRAIIEELAHGERTVGELAAPHDVSLPAISQQLRVLEAAGLLTQTKDGRLRICNLEARPLSEAFSWILRYRVMWEDLLDDIQAKVEDQETRPPPGPTPAKRT